MVFGVVGEFLAACEFVASTAVYASLSDPIRKMNLPTDLVDLH